MNVKCDVIGLLALAVGGLFVSSLTTAGVLVGLPLLVFGIVVGTTTARRIRNRGTQFTNVV